MSKSGSTKSGKVDSGKAKADKSAKAKPAKKAPVEARPAKVKAAKPSVAKSAVAKPAVARTRKTSTDIAASTAQPADTTLKIILSRLDDMKAEETVTIDLRGKSAFSDYIVITSGRANRHVGAIAESVTKGLKQTGIKNIHVEGLTNCDWVLIDSGDVVVHVFRPEVREFYNLERLWTQSPPAANAI